MATANNHRVVTVIDIECPACGRTRPVRKERIGAYRCTACGNEFDHGDVDPVDQSRGSEPDGR